MTISNRITPAQEEIAYQVTQNVEMERYPRTALSKYNLVPTLPNNLIGTKLSGHLQHLQQLRIWITTSSRNL